MIECADVYIFAKLLYLSTYYAKHRHIKPSCISVPSTIKSDYPSK